MTTVGFVGATGLMGHGMAKNIARAGMSLSYTLRSESQRVEEVVDSLLEEPREGLVIVDSSTSEPTSTMKLSERARAQGVGYVDVPLTKGPAAAEAGDLNVMVGGAEADVARVLPVLEAFAGSVLRTGDVGTAHTLKLVNNTVIQAFCNALAEGFTVAGKAGLDPRLVHEILGRGSMNAPFLHAIAGALDGDHAGATAGLYRRASPYCQSLRSPRTRPTRRSPGRPQRRGDPPARRTLRTAQPRRFRAPCPQSAPRRTRVDDCRRGMVAWWCAGKIHGVSRFTRQVPFPPRICDSRILPSASSHLRIPSSL